jgi:NAD+ synthase (glutamine-hydrolysing)
VIGVRLPSRFTTDLSNDLAETQARTLGVELLTIPIGPPFAGFVETLAPAFSTFAAQASASDVTEENIQSRCRGVILMALSNRTGRMLLSTGNKSEYAVGYATIYGDMCGGYAPLKDCYKQLVYALSRWRNGDGAGIRDSRFGIGRARSGAFGEAGLETGNGERGGSRGASALRPQQSEVIPQQVIDRPPSAELRENQTDQDSLPPYEVLDAILDRFIDGEQSQAEIVAAGFDGATVRRIAQLVLRSEYKRRQAAPGPKISKRAFGRDRRYPITSGWG